jgi:hypothetical protein
MNIDQYTVCLLVEYPIYHKKIAIILAVWGRMTIARIPRRQRLKKRTSAPFVYHHDEPDICIRRTRVAN